MAQLIVRKVDEKVVRLLKRRAVEHGRSMEAEHREILRQALLPRAGAGSLKRMLLEVPEGLSDDDLVRRPGRPRAIDHET